jgi:hypothetical protein
MKVRTSHACSTCDIRGPDHPELARFSALLAGDALKRSLLARLIILRVLEVVPSAIYGKYFIPDQFSGYFISCYLHQRSSFIISTAHAK